MTSIRVRIWVVVAAAALCGTIASVLVFSPKVSIPLFLRDSKKPVQVWRRGSNYYDSTLTGSSLPFRVTMTEYYVEGTRPEEIIENLSTESGIKREFAHAHMYGCEIGGTEYRIEYSPFSKYPGTTVLSSEMTTGVSSLDLWLSRVWPAWDEFWIGSVNSKPMGSDKVPTRPKLDLARVKRARPKIKFK